MKMMPWQCHFSMCDDSWDNLYTKSMEKVFSSFNGVDYLSEQNGKFLCLKNVKINCTEKLYSCDEDQSNKNKCFDFELKVVAHIIRNTPVLEKLVILSPKAQLL